MRKLFSMLLVLFVLYLLIQFGFKFFGHGQTIKYQIKTDNNNFNVKEVYTLNHKNETNNYYIEVEINNVVFPFQTYENFGYSDTILKQIKYFKDDKYECILPIFRNDKIIYDVMCMHNDKIFYYHDLLGVDILLDEFVNKLEVTNYNSTIWQDNINEKTEDGPVIVYGNNILDNHFIGINNYKGLYTINNYNFKKIYNISIFNKDVYARKLSAMVDKFYITADYGNDYEFDKFYIVDITSNEVKTAISNTNISFDSYLQGIVDESLYIFDRSNKKQYEVNTATNKVIEIGNGSIGVKVYRSGEWNYVDIGEAIRQNLLFKKEDEKISDDNYIKIDKEGNKLSGYYYFYKKDNNSYKVYRSNVQNKKILIYLFTVNNIEDIRYVSDYVYFSDNKKVKYYNDKTGIRTVFENEEFIFNDSLYYSVYFKK